MRGVSERIAGSRINVDQVLWMGVCRRAIMLHETRKDLVEALAAMGATYQEAPPYATTSALAAPAPPPPTTASQGPTATSAPSPPKPVLTGPGSNMSASSPGAESLQAADVYGLENPLAVLANLSLSPGPDDEDDDDYRPPSASRAEWVVQSEKYYSAGEKTLEFRRAPSCAADFLLRRLVSSST